MSFYSHNFFVELVQRCLVHHVMSLAGTYPAPLLNVAYVIQGNGVTFP